MRLRRPAFETVERNQEQGAQQQFSGSGSSVLEWRPQQALEHEIATAVLAQGAVGQVLDRAALPGAQRRRVRLPAGGERRVQIASRSRPLGCASLACLPGVVVDDSGDDFS